MDWADRKTSRETSREKRVRIMSLISDIGAGAAVVVSAYSLWQTSLKRPALRVFVSPVIRYASPYQNSNFEVFAVPLTIHNEGARTGTILALDLVVKNSDRSLSKRFYSADVGQWSVEKSQKGDFTPFAPIVLAGRTSHTETILFHARRDEKVMQIVEKEGSYHFALTLQGAQSEKPGFLERFQRQVPKLLAFDMELPYLDHRAFTSGSGTLALHHKDWQTTIAET
jgi:hypothetical protein